MHSTPPTGPRPFSPRLRSTRRALRRATPALLLCATALAGAAPLSLDEFRALPDNRVAVRTSLGLRSARPLSARQVELMFGLSVTEAAGKAAAYRVISDDDARYAYESFVTPTQAEVRVEEEAPGTPGSPFPLYRHTRVTLDLPDPMKIGCHYTVVAQGFKENLNGGVVTGGHTAQTFLFDGHAAAAPDTATLDHAVLGLRRISPIGPSLLMLELGPDFAATHAADLDHYAVRINGTPVTVTNVGRITKVDTYITRGWPYAVIPMHEVFLQLAKPFAEGDTIEVTLDPVLDCASPSARLQFKERATISPSLKVNQIGYLTESPAKIAYLGRWMGSFPEIKTGTAAPGGAALSFDQPPVFAICTEAAGQAVYTATSRLAHVSGTMNEGARKVDHSGENVYVLDFTALKQPGRYFIAVPGVGRSLPFEIGADVYLAAFRTAALGLFQQRCGLALGPPYCAWHRIACHTNGLVVTTLQHRKDVDIRTLPKFATAARLQASGGHHDAGDYNPRSHIEVAQTLMNAWEIAPQKFADSQLSIPEKGNGIPDSLDEAQWALRLWLDMQDADGGVYNGTESAGDPGFMQTVELDDKGDYVFAKDAEGSYTFAGTLAQASRIWARLGHAREAADYLQRAKRAYAWAQQHPSGNRAAATARNPGDLASAAYAAAELLRTTGEAAYNRDFLAAAVWAGKPDADLDVYNQYDQSGAAWAYANCPTGVVDHAVQAAAKKAILRKAAMLIQGSSTMAYAFIRHPWSPINWGTGAYANGLDPIIWAWSLTGDDQYRYWMVRTCDNMLGDNPLGLSWIVSAGTRTIRAPLHNSRYSALGEVVDGMQSEGPNERADGYRVKETAYPPPNERMAMMYTFVDAHFAIGMDEGVSPAQAKAMAALGLLLPDR